MLNPRGTRFGDNDQPSQQTLGRRRRELLWITSRIIGGNRRSANRDMRADQIKQFLELLHGQATRLLVDVGGALTRVEHVQVDVDVGAVRRARQRRQGGGEIRASAMAEHIRTDCRDAGLLSPVPSRQENLMMLSPEC
jgi:hypothetical protein